MKYPFTVAIIGSGYMGKRHMSVFCEKVERVILCSNDEEGGKALAAQYGCAFYGDYKEMLKKEHVDIASVCVPTPFHASITLDFLRAGVHVLCEKPFASSMEEAEEMLRVSQETDKLLMIAHCQRFYKKYEYLKHCIEDQRFGKLLYLNLFRHFGMPTWSVSNWLFDVNVSGGAVRDLHVHDTDLIHHYLGMPKSVLTTGNPVSCSTVYQYGNGVAVTASGSWRAAEAFEGVVGYDAGFEKAVVELKSHKLTVATDNGVSEVALAEESFPTFLDENYYNNEIEYFCQCVQNGEQPTFCHPSHTLDTLRINMAEFQSLTTGEAVKLY